MLSKQEMLRKHYFTNFQIKLIQLKEKIAR